VETERVPYPSIMFLRKWHSDTSVGKPLNVEQLVSAPDSTSDEHRMIPYKVCDKSWYVKQI
jgi:hypothetical protein